MMRAVGQREALALGAGGQQHGAHAGGLADAVVDHIGHFMNCIVS
jgi:hypothetical protein